MSAEDEPPFPVPTPAQIAAVIARHGLPVRPEQAVPLAAIGTVNAVIALGDFYVLRVPKPYGARETRREAVAAPAAYAAGVRSPRLIAFDESGAVFDAPYTIYERIAGRNFGLCDFETEASAAVFREIGRQIAILHRGVTMCEDPHGLLEEIARESPDALLDELGARALMSAPNVRWLAGVFARLRPFVEEARAYRRFLHNDVLPTNVMVGPDGAFAALIDWSDCGWGDPATDFVDTPARFLPLVLAGYREIGPIDGDASAEARILWDHLVRALRRLRREPMIGNVNWERPPFARPTELLAGAARIETWRRFLA